MEKKEESRTGAIIGAIAAIVLCGVIGLCGWLPFSIFIFGWGKDALDIPNAWGTLFLCLSLIFIVIGVVVPIVLLRKKKEPKKVEDVLPPNEPLPPAS